MRLGCCLCLLLAGCEFSLHSERRVIPATPKETAEQQEFKAWKARRDAGLGCDTTEYALGDILLYTRADRECECQRELLQAYHMEFKEIPHCITNGPLPIVRIVGSCREFVGFGSVVEIQAEQRHVLHPESDPENVPLRMPQEQTIP